MDHHRRQGVIWWRVLGWVMSLTALGFIVRWLLGLDPAVWSSLWHVRPGDLVWAVVWFQLWFLLRYIAWHWISRRHGGQLAHHQNIRLWTISELMRYIPGNIWSFATRYRGTVDSGTDRLATLQALVVEVLGLVSGAAVMSALLTSHAAGWWVALAIIAVGPVTIPFLLPWLGRRWHRQLPSVSLGEMTGLVLWYAMVWIVFGYATTLVYQSFPTVPGLSVSALMGVNIFAWLIGYVTIVTPMGLGVREVAFVRLLSGRVTTAVASLVAVVTRVWFILSELVFLGLVLVWSSWRAKR